MLGHRSTSALRDDNKIHNRGAARCGAALVPREAPRIAVKHERNEDGCGDARGGFRADEQWRPLPEDPRYTVSNHGRVRGVRGALLVPQRNGHGYHKVKLGGTRNRRVHRMIAEAFLGPCPAGMQVCHKNGIKTDNRSANLMWGMPDWNARQKRWHGVAPCPFLVAEHERRYRFERRISHAKWTDEERIEIWRENGRRNGALMRGEGNHRARLRECDVRDIRTQLRCGVTQKEVARRFSVSRVLVWRIAHGERWGHVS